MIATYQVKPNEFGILEKILQSYLTTGALKITIEPVSPQLTAETQEEVNARILRTIEAEKSGLPPFKIMTMEEMEAMVQ
ncbi:hypothetical protein FACS1894139_01040 [Planctomycetales bacterium]|nr:hypothetical protein FACS1894107_04210 [Planctomycetales bacterium]GHT01030.1 hypothetical protein FACS1894108_14280 [Planctomycetales bacterium]GHT02593.1 hypothetical protein FACS1894139_01040 [Planctomycetales bacterium]GHV22789.1 hypothetical protein AGMMS49959_14260 [Planctomycetales bacterium]